MLVILIRSGTSVRRETELIYQVGGPSSNFPNFLFVFDFVSPAVFFKLSSFSATKTSPQYHNNILSGNCRIIIHCAHIIIKAFNDTGNITQEL